MQLVHGLICWITSIDATRFPANHPFTIIPDARAFTRSDVGGLIIGLRESQCQAFDLSTLTEKLEDFDFNKAAKWTVLDECAPLLKKYLKDIDDLPIDPICLDLPAMCRMQNSLLVR